MKLKFYKCKVCGQIIAIVNDSGAPIICCGEEMKKLEPLTNEKDFHEKHIPTYTLKNGKLIVKIGSLIHPMNKDHFIEWVAIVTNKGNQRKMLKPGDSPIVTFCLDEGEVVEEIYAYCNIHSLWKLNVSTKDFRDKKRCGCMLDDFDKK